MSDLGCRKGGSNTGRDRVTAPPTSAVLAGVTVTPHRTASLAVVVQAGVWLGERLDNMALARIQTLIVCPTDDEHTCWRYHPAKRRPPCRESPAEPNRCCRRSATDAFVTPGSTASSRWHRTFAAKPYGQCCSG